jgi:hypothetical protein
MSIATAGHVLPYPITKASNARSTNWNIDISRRHSISRRAYLAVRSIRGLGTGLAGPPNDRGALVGVAVGWPPGEEGFLGPVQPPRPVSDGPPLGCCKQPPPAAFSGNLRSPPGSPRLLWVTRRRFDPSCSPSATRPSVQASASTSGRKSPSKSGVFEDHGCTGDCRFLPQLVWRRHFSPRLRTSSI